MSGMSFMHAAPEALATAASNIAGIGTEISTANAAAALPTTGVLAAAADQVSAEVAALFSSHAQGYQQLSAQVAAFHDKFVQVLSAGANSYATTEASAARNLATAVNTPSVGQNAGGVASNAAARIQGLFKSVGGSSPIGGNLLAQLPTGSLAAPGALLGPLGKVATAAAAPAAASFGDSIKNLYNFVEPYVAYGFNLATYVAGFAPWVGFLAPQINFFYYLFEPMVQSGLFNIIDFLGGTITFSQGLSNFWGVTTASINQFINTEINWFLSFLPPLPPLPPFFP
jgi:hypothetical protein